MTFFLFQDITPTGGCAALGLKLPLLERELLKTEEAPAPPNAGGGRGKMLLYLGQVREEEYVNTRLAKNS